MPRINNIDFDNEDTYWNEADSENREDDDCSFSLEEQEELDELLRDDEAEFRWSSF